MSDNATLESTATIAPDLENQDLTLEMLTKFAYGDRVSLGMPVTLAFGGMLVSGHICTGRDFLLDLQSKTDEALASQGSDPGTWEQLFQPYVDDYYPDGTVPERCQFIHLRGARFLVPGSHCWPDASNPGVFWRGRISEVSGWHLGVLA